MEVPEPLTGVHPGQDDQLTTTELQAAKHPHALLT